MSEQEPRRNCQNCGAILSVRQERFYDGLCEYGFKTKQSRTLWSGTGKPVKHTQVESTDR